MIRSLPLAVLILIQLQARIIFDQTFLIATDLASGGRHNLIEIWLHSMIFSFDFFLLSFREPAKFLFSLLRK